MTLDQFKAQRWTAGMRGEYYTATYKIISVKFDEMLIGLQNPLDDNELTWVRCENVTLLNDPHHQRARPEK